MLLAEALLTRRNWRDKIRRRRIGMFMKKGLLVCFFVAAVQVFLAAQTHMSIPLGHPVYHVIEQAQIRGLLRFFPSARPYTRAQILSMIDQILDNDTNLRFGGLTPEERGTLLQFRQDLNPQRGGFDPIRGTISRDHIWNDIYFSGEFGFGVNLGFSASVFPIAGGFRHTPSDDPDDPFSSADHPASGDFFTGMNSGFYFSWQGDLGRNFSYGMIFGGAFLHSPRAVLGRTNNFQSDFIPIAEDPARVNRQLIAFGEPLTYFPFTYNVVWDGSVWFLGNLDAGGFEGWPQTLSVGYYLLPELSGALLNGHIVYRFASQRREWGGMLGSSSLLLNESAQPFLAGEITVMPFRWFTFSALTGVLEYGMNLETGGGGIKSAAETFQNAFSINMLEINLRNFFHVSFGSATVWPKRFELGYLFPLADTFLYQNNIGDFDNSALFFNFMGQYPGLGRFWFSAFLDEISLGDINREFFNMTRMMFAYQIGTSIHVPWFRRLAFNALTISYTRVNPYNYTHTRELIPGYGNLLMETNWVNRGRSLGHYLPPNSDELLVRFTAMPFAGGRMSVQYQLIRHGAVYGDRAVGGSSLWSELNPRERQSMRSFFLRDGAYEWMNIVRLRREYSFTAINLPIRVFAEIGGVYSFFTDIRGSIDPAKTSPASFRRINTPQYPQSLRFIANLGVQLFPK